MKKALMIFLCLCLLLPVFACGEQQGETGRIGIISAMDNEAALLLAEAEIDHVDTVGGVDFHVGKLCGQDVVIARAGVGKILSASGTSSMLSHYPVTSLIFTGIAGGVGDETQVLDMVIADELVQHDYGTQGQEGFVWNPPFRRVTPYSFCDEALADAAYDAAVEVVGKEHVFRGLIVTGDQFVASEAFVQYLQEEFGAVACEMEGASVALVCEQYGVPFVVIRAMSDKADGKAHESVLNMGDLAADHSGRIVMRMLEKGFTPAGEEAADESGEKTQAAYDDKLFDRKTVHRIDVRLAEEDWTGLLADPAAKTKYTSGVTIDGEAFDNVAFSTKGFSSLYLVAYGQEESRRYSFRLNFGKFQAGQTYHGLDSLSLNNLFCDNTWMKDLICYDLFRDAGVAAPLVSYVWLTVNGEDQGLYMAVEDEHTGFLNRAYQGEGVIYSVDRPKANVTREGVEYILKNGFPPVSDTHGSDLVYSGENLANYPDILDNAKTEERLRDKRLVTAALRALSLGENIDRYFDMDEIIRFFAAHNCLLNFDSYTGSQLNNLVLREKDGQLSVIPWDYNLAFGTLPSILGDQDAILKSPTWLLNLGIDTPLIRAEEEDRPLWHLIRSRPEYLDQYHEILNELLEDHLLRGEYEEKVDELRELLLPWIRKDPTAFCTAEEFERGCDAMKAFLACRTESIRRQLAGELSADTGEQDPQAMVDASDLNLRDLGALVFGE